MVQTGFMCSVEGLEGTGKTALCAALAESFRAEGYTVRETCDLGVAGPADQIRAWLRTPRLAQLDPMTRAILLTAARREHVNNVIRPALSRGEIILCERFIHSTLVHESALTSLSASHILDLHRIGCDDFWPDFTLLLDTSAADSDHALGNIPPMQDGSRLARAFRNAMKYTPHEQYGIIDATLPPQDRLAKALRLLKHSEPFAEVERMYRARGTPAQK